MGASRAVQLAAAGLPQVRPAADSAQQMPHRPHRLRSVCTGVHDDQAQSEIAAITPNRLFIPRPQIPAVMVQVAVTAGQRKIPITADLIRRTVVENRFDFRKSINSLEFYGNSRGSVDCCWPFHRVGSDWAFHPSWLALDDEISLYFAFSNFLLFFCDVSRNETPCETSRETPASRVVSIDSVRPSVLSTQGGEVEIRGEMEKVAEVWLNGKSSKKLEIRKRETSSLVVVIPAGLSGLHFLEFHLRNGLIGAFREEFPWFGNVGIRVKSGNEETWNSENEFENPMEFETDEMEKRGKKRRKIAEESSESSNESSNELSNESSNESLNESSNESNTPIKPIESNEPSHSNPSNSSIQSNDLSHTDPLPPSSSSSFSSSISILSDLCECYEALEVASLLTSTSAHHFKVPFFSPFSRSDFLRGLCLRGTLFPPLFLRFPRGNGHLDPFHLLQTLFLFLFPTLRADQQRSLIQTRCKTAFASVPTIHLGRRGSRSDSLHSWI